MENLPHDPAQLPAPASYHWTPALQRQFLEHVADTGSVRIAADRVGMSPSAAYQLKQRPEGAAFRLGWAAAVLIARARLADELLDRAIYGQEETTAVFREEERSLVKRRRTDARLGLAMLARLDRMVETRAEAGEAMLAQVIAGDWTGFLALFDIDPDAQAADAHTTDARPAEGRAAALACWLAGRDNRANPLAALWHGSRIADELSQFSADSETAPAPPTTPAEAAAALTVWFDDIKREWRTNFPPPGDFLGDEEEAMEAAQADYVAPLRQAGEAARRAFFDRLAPANDREGGDKNGAREDAKTQSG